MAPFVARFTQQGRGARASRHGGGSPVPDGPAERERERIRADFPRAPDRQRAGTASWSLPTCQRALRRAPHGRPQGSTWTILHTLWDAGSTGQQAPQP